MVIPNYVLIEKIAESQQAAVYKAYHRKEPGRLLALKVLKATFLSDLKKIQLRQRIEHLRVLKDPLVITPIALDAKDGIHFLTQEYFDGVTLDTLAGTRSPVSLADFFAVACRLAGTLDKVHEAGIIHGGIKPHNILVCPQSLDIRLIDFVSVVDVRDVSHFIYDRSYIENALSYTSPEQTGRINHRVVFSSDLYSLGVVFYELLAGRLPFSSDDPLELIHSHLAEDPPKVHELRPDIPIALSRIVAKLMLKEPEKRYQSGNGLLADLARCRDEYSAAGTIQEFPLESSVSTHRVTFISRMVGRDREAGLILEEYERAARGAFRSLFISGLSGIGKTRLIQELQKPIVRHRGYFTSGKFDVYQKNIPYSSLIQALRNLMRTFLTESDERVAHWKSRIQQAVGANGKVLTDVIPELEVLIGPQPEAPPLPPVESLNRFHDLFDRFLACLASEEHPLTLFIDDLQWCDAASFDFLANIFANCQDHPCLLLLGAYRHNEVDSSHPLSRLIRGAAESGWPLKEVRLGPLQPEHCHEMVSYILDSPLSQTRELSDFISSLSEGNPLFVSESLSYLHNESLLFLDEERQWRWDLERIRQSRMPTSVVALFSSKIRKLRPDMIELLEYCACLGNAFSPAEISSIREMTLLATFEKLKPALGQGLLMEAGSRLQFIHDRVQEAVLSAIPEEKRRRIHRHVGDCFLAAIPQGADLEKLENLFTIVSHLNLGLDRKPDAETAYLLADLNYHAGNKALDSLATEAANEYFRLSRELLPADCWAEGRYERTFRIYQKAAKTELMCGNYADSERLLTELLDHAKTDLDKAECLAEQTTSLSSIGNFIKAIETANRGLAYFGKAIPDSPEEADRRREELMAEIGSQDIDIWDAILSMPFTTDRKSKIELAFYSELIPDLYMSGLVPQLYLSAAQSTQHCLAGGMDESVIYSFSIMGLQLGEREEFQQAFRYEDLARDLSAKYPNTFGATRGMNGIVWCNMHSRSHPRQIVDYCLKSIQCGKNCGDLYNAGLSYGPLMWNLQVQGADLSVVEEYARECLHFSGRYHLSFSVGLAEAMQAGWIEPMKKDPVPAPSMEEKLGQWERDNHIASAGSYYVHRALTHYYLGEHEEAQRYLAGVRRYLSGLTDNVLKRQWHVFGVLNALKLYEKKAGAASRQDLLAEIQPFVRKIETWAALGPLLKPYLAFLSAELERVTGDGREASIRYLEAITTAHEQGYTFLEGHLNEGLGELLQQAGRCSARVFFVEAARLYRKCRAERKELRLVEKHPEYFEEERPPLPYSGAEVPSPRTLPNLDVDYLMKSSLAISAEIELDSLLKKIMNVVVESSGAQYGYLLIEEEGSLFIRAESHITEKQVVQMLNQKLEDAGDICKAIVRYVYRTAERVILNDAAQEGAFKDNPEVQSMQLRSVLCLPVIRQSKMIGILYLENRLSDGVFTSEKAQMTELLTSQAAISLENAILFNRQQQAEQALRDRENELRLIMDTVPALISYVDSEYRYRRVNKTYERWLGITAEEVCGRHVREILSETSWQAVRPNIERALAGERVSYQVELSFGGGGPRWLESTYVPDRDEAGRVCGFVVHAVDIGEMKKAEEQIKRSLREKEALLKEIHHRVKNNLQIVHSMLNLQLPFIKDEQAVELFKESQNRIYSMALIHEKLYQSESLVKIDLAEYIRSLTANLFLSYGVSERAIRLQISVEDVTLNIDTVIPCALIINELVSNSLKHAFPAPIGPAAAIRVGLRREADGQFLLAVGDNGVGLPEGFDIQRSESLGLKLVGVLVRQLQGTVRLGTRGGTEFAIAFKAIKGKGGD
jgi:PAS domain S-box-containing protein